MCIKEEQCFLPVYRKTLNNILDNVILYIACLYSFNKWGYRGNEIISTTDDSSMKNMKHFIFQSF